MRRRARALNALAYFLEIVSPVNFERVTFQIVGAVKSFLANVANVRWRAYVMRSVSGKANSCSWVGVTWDSHVLGFFGFFC